MCEILTARLPANLVAEPGREASIVHIDEQQLERMTKNSPTSEPYFIRATSRGIAPQAAIERADGLAVDPFEMRRDSSGAGSDSRGGGYADEIVFAGRLRASGDAASMRVARNRSAFAIEARLRRMVGD